MKCLRIRKIERPGESGRNIYKIDLQDEKVLEGGEDYAKYKDYFRKLLMAVPECVENFTYILEITAESTYLSLYLNKAGRQNIKEVIRALKKLDEVEEVGLWETYYGVELSITDVFTTCL